MTYKYAKDLHNGDEVSVKKSGEITTVISTEVSEKDIYIYAMTQEGYTKLHHRDIG